MTVTVELPLGSVKDVVVVTFPEVSVAVEEVEIAPLVSVVVVDDEDPVLGLDEDVVTEEVPSL